MTQTPEIAKRLADLREALNQYGPVTLHHETGNLLQVRIEYFPNTLSNLAAAGKLCVEHFPEFPYIAQCRVDTGIFNLTLKP